MNFLYLFFAIRYSEVNSQLRVNSLVDRIQSFTMDHARGRGGYNYSTSQYLRDFNYNINSNGCHEYINISR